MANSLPPAPIDNDPKPGDPKSQDKHRAWLSANAWSSFKTWFNLLYQLLKGLQSDQNGNIIVTGNETINGSLSVAKGINGLPFPDGDNFGSFQTLGQVLSGRLLAIRVFSTVGSVTYTPTAGTSFVIAKVQGGGAAGGGPPATGAGQQSAGAGGGSGGYIETLIASGFNGVTITVGAGGTGSAGASGGNGGNSSFGAFTANGGLGGTNAAVGTFGAAQGGAGGGNSGTGNIFNAQGSAGANTATTFGGTSIAGAGGGSLFGGGGVGMINTTGGAAASYGAAGGGAVLGQSSAALAGGNGFQGVVIVWEFTTV